jgi:opacity protein-like surface antigen
LSALVVSLLGGLVSVLPARAQMYEVARQSLSLSPDPIVRSPRLLGLGRLTLVVPDVNNRLTLWDFAGNPTGLIEADSVSTVSVRPGSSSASGVGDVNDGVRKFERQFLGAQESRVGYEAWRRNKGASVFGAIGSFGMLRLDRPYSGNTERRSQFTSPSVETSINGRLPYFKSDRLRYALRATYAYESANDQFRAFSSNAAGEYLDHDGGLGGPPDVFTPIEYDTQMQGAGAAVSVRVAEWLTLAAGADALRYKIKGVNRGARYLSERAESRPMGIGQVSMVGRVGPSLEWAADGRGWTSSSDETWVYTISTNTGGAGAAPLTGRGDLRHRGEDGSRMRTRLRWTTGVWEVGAGYGTSWQRVLLKPRPDVNSNSFNRFLDEIFYRTRADTTLFPDSVVYQRSEDRAWEVGAGLSWRFPNRRGIAGIEYHRGRDLLDQEISGQTPQPSPLPGFTVSRPGQPIPGQGPRRVAWDVRGGLEYQFSPIFSGRMGYIYRREDLDEFTKQNEWLSNAVTLGMGLRPAGSMWALETGYLFEWSQADYGSPSSPRGTSQQLGAQIQWTF